MPDEFKVHRLNALGFQRAEAIASEFEKLLQEICVMVPPGRERALVVTKLQEACFFAKRALALSPENQEP